MFADEDIRFISINKEKHQNFDMFWNRIKELADAGHPIAKDLNYMKSGGFINGRYILRTDAETIECFLSGIPGWFNDDNVTPVNIEQINLYVHKNSKGENKIINQPEYSELCKAENIDEFIPFDRDAIVIAIISPSGVFDLNTSQLRVICGFEVAKQDAEDYCIYVDTVAHKGDVLNGFLESFDIGFKAISIGSDSSLDEVFNCLLKLNNINDKSFLETSFEKRYKVFELARNLYAVSERIINNATIENLHSNRALKLLMDQNRYIQSMLGYIHS
jgi:hypothetical protein